LVVLLMGPIPPAGWSWTARATSTAPLTPAAEQDANEVLAQNWSSSVAAPCSRSMRVARKVSCIRSKLPMAYSRPPAWCETQLAICSEPPTRGPAELHALNVWLWHGFQSGYDRHVQRAVLVQGAGGRTGWRLSSGWLDARFRGQSLQHYRRRGLCYRVSEFAARELWHDLSADSCWNRNRAILL